MRSERANRNRRRSTAEEGQSVGATDGMHRFEWEGARQARPRYAVARVRGVRKKKAASPRGDDWLASAKCLVDIRRGRWGLVRCVCRSGCDPWGVGGKVCWHRCLGHGAEMGVKRQDWGTSPRAWRGSYLTPSAGRFWEDPQRGGAAFAHAAQCSTPTCSAKVSHDGVARLCTPLQPSLDDVWAEEDVTCLTARQRHLLDPASGGQWRASSSGVCLFWKPTDFVWGADDSPPAQARAAREAVDLISLDTWHNHLGR